MKTAILTGASKGIGAACAEKLYQDYDFLALIARNSDGALDRLVKRLSGGRDASGSPCVIVPYAGDVSDHTFVSSAVSDIVSRAGQVDLLVNNAGISEVGLLTDMTPEAWNRIVSVNLTSMYNTCHVVVPHMVRAQAGRIINISSIWGLVGASCEVAYSATKGGVNAFTMALAKELAPSGIAVNAIAFGCVDTEMNQHLSDEERAALAEELPTGRMITVNEAADTILKLSEFPLSYTGSVLKADGGWY